MKRETIYMRLSRASLDLIEVVVVCARHAALIG